MIDAIRKLINRYAVRGQHYMGARLGKVWSCDIVDRVRKEQGMRVTQWRDSLFGGAHSGLDILPAMELVRMLRNERTREMAIV